MPTSTTKEATDIGKLLGVSVKDVNPNENIRITRGRQKSQDVLAIRDVLRECVKSQSAKAFTVDEGDLLARNKKKDELIRKIRSAAAGGAEDNSDLDVATSWDGGSNTLYFGHRPAIEKMMNKKAKPAEATA